MQAQLPYNVMQIASIYQLFHVFASSLSFPFPPRYCIWTEVKSLFKTWENHCRSREAKWCHVLSFVMQ